MTIDHTETDIRLRRYEDLRDLLPGPADPTPLVRLRRLPPPGTSLYLKLEWMSPFGSIKDRTARYMLDGLEARGLVPDKVLVEPTSGNTGIALAALAVLAGTRLIATVPSGVPDAKKVLMRMLGAEVWETPDELCPVDNPKDGAIALARALAASSDDYVMPNQYANPDNVRAHYETTGPEIWAQTEGEVEVFVAGLGTAGTLTGVGRYLKERNPAVRVVAVEPQPGHRLPGLKSLQESKQPEILDWSVIDEVVRVDDEPAYATTKALYRTEALMVGPSTGAVVRAALDLEGVTGLIVGISPDSGFKYTSYFAEILGDEGLPTV
ncbi:MAG: cysteine synthase family protein [Actinomycetota bacterium]